MAFNGFHLEPEGNGYGDDTAPFDSAASEGPALPASIEEAQSIETDNTVEREVQARESVGFSSNPVKRIETYAIPGNGFILCEEVFMLGDDSWNLNVSSRSKLLLQVLCLCCCLRLFGHIHTV